TPQGGPLPERVGLSLPRAARRRRRRGRDLLPRAARSDPRSIRQPRLPPRQPRGGNRRRSRLPRRVRPGLRSVGADLLRRSRRRVLLAARRGHGRDLRRRARTRGRERACYHRNDPDPSKEAVRMKKYQLMAPGPTPVPTEVLLAMARPMIHHRTPQYEALFVEVRAGLKKIFQTTADVIPLACSGTGAMEAAVVNTLSAGDSVAVVRAGKFADRWVEICKAYGVTVVEMTAPFGHSVPAERVAETLRTEAHFTPAVGIIVGLREVLRMLEAEGLASVFKRHDRLARATRAGVEALGLELFAKATPSPALTAVAAPTGVDSETIVAAYSKTHNITIAGGQGEMKGKVFRLGHM